MSSGTENEETQTDPGTDYARAPTTIYTHKLSMEVYEMGKIHIVFFGLFGNENFSIVSVGDYYIVTTPSPVSEVDQLAAQIDTF